MADPAFLKPVVNILKIDILLGAEYVENCLINNSKRIDSLTLRDTQFGWTITGSIPNTLSHVVAKPITSLITYMT